MLVTIIRFSRAIILSMITKSRRYLIKELMIIHCHWVLVNIQTWVADSLSFADRIDWELVFWLSPVVAALLAAVFDFMVATTNSRNLFLAGFEARIAQGQCLIVGFVSSLPHWAMGILAFIFPSLRFWDSFGRRTNLCQFCDGFRTSCNLWRHY